MQGGLRLQLEANLGYMKLPHTNKCVEVRLMKSKLYCL